MGEKILFEKLSHVRYIPKQKWESFQLLHKKGEPIVKLTWFGGEKTTKKVYEEDMYGYCGSMFREELYTKEEAIKYRDIEERRFDEEGYIWEDAKVVVHFLDGDKLTINCETEEIAQEKLKFFETYLSNSINIRYV